ncbi:hypothetical protein DNTS_001888 [Danionella cerebrum]|uniref:Nuclear receptor-interacting protein 1 repression domain-containing protein n=1 Tax=Danionella cerebrum TaxID=2873325 RepID=A0A553PVW7_9TELE|nr:hypothetical protein DNTS_001888 [Danionella translucida]
MHQVAGGQGVAATQSGGQEQKNKDGTGCAQPNHATRQEQNRTNSHFGASQHLRKARLLNSEAWSDSETHPRSAPSAVLNGPSEDHHSGQNGSSHDKGESTLLASLLQSFSSRLQNVTLPQQIIQGLRPPDASCQISKPAQEDKADVPYHRPASSHLKELVSKSKLHKHSNGVPYHHQQSSRESLSESPKALQSSTPSPSPESLSCTERLKAVANMVNIRSSPAPSPKPSVACSQLALLLSSEAHLQQYSREHALKAKLSGRLASERLSAMATHQTPDKQPSTSSQTLGLSQLHTENGIPTQMSTSFSRQSPNLSSGQRRTEGSMRSGHRFRDRRPFEKQGRQSQNCSSLLLQLLNSHNTSPHINGQGHLKDDLKTFATSASPMFSDSEHSNPDSSLTKDSSDAESTYSSCSPIDLSMKSRTYVQTPLSASSSAGQDRIPESFFNKWKLESPPLNHSTDPKEVESCSEMKPHHKVTLLQLLLDHKNNERVNKGLDNPDLPQAVIPKVTSGSTSSRTVFSSDGCKQASDPIENCGLSCKSPKIFPTFSQNRDSNSSGSPYTIYGSPHPQCVPLDLCKAKQPTTDSRVKEPAFSASKLLQNLAQCGKQNPEVSPQAKPHLSPIKLVSQEIKVNHPSTLLDRLTAPIQRNNLREETKTKTSTLSEAAQHVSEIENLLERRTVLQLLLGNASQKESVCNKRKREHGKNNSMEKQTRQTVSQANGSPLDITIKTEPSEDGPANDYQKMSKHCHNLALDTRKSTSYLSQENIKQEPLSPEAPNRDGLLCHLLKKRSNKTLQPSNFEDLHKSFVEEESIETQGPTIPKKRKLSVELDYHNSLSQQVNDLEYSGSIKQDNNGCFDIEERDTREDNKLSSPPEADSPPARFPAQESNENGSFNVLKQLLLSDNCLKELSQPRSTFSSPVHSLLNGNASKQTCNDVELQKIHQTFSPSTVSCKKASAHRHEPQHVAHLEPTRSKVHYSTMKDLKGPPKMVNGEDQTSKHGTESPRFTKTNPILYYMLQRSNAQLSKEAEGLDIGSGKMQTKVKNETSGDTEAFEL